jgi:murein DD-endopeptidase MepM/ murein hydrolase activator NlpD
MRIHRSEKTEGRGRAIAAIVFAGVALSACSHFDKEPPIADGPGAARHFNVTVREGDTIYGISRRNDVRVQDLIDANDLTDKDVIYAGEVLRIPGAYRAPKDYAARTVPVPQPKPRYSRNATVTLVTYKPDEGDNSMFGRTRAMIDRLGGSSGDRDVSAWQDTSGDSARFVWPVSGRIISSFGKASTGERNDGINIAASLGTPIHAAADGVVTYSGNELKGYGNLVLIKHDDDYVTAYAHAERTVVSRGDSVKKGQIIAYTGETGDVTEPQLHFEIRHDTKPIDPRPLLMASR